MDKFTQYFCMRFSLKSLTLHANVKYQTVTDSFVKTDLL